MQINVSGLRRVCGKIDARKKCGEYSSPGEEKVMRRRQRRARKRSRKSSSQRKASVLAAAALDEWKLHAMCGEKGRHKCVPKYTTTKTAMRSKDVHYVVNDEMERKKEKMRTGVGKRCVNQRNRGREKGEDFCGG